MRKIITILFLSLTTLTLFAQNSSVENGVDTEEKGINLFDIVKMSGNWFIAYKDGQSQNNGVVTKHTNQFVLKRSYFTLKKDLNKTFSVRYTMDLTVDKEGSDAGNVETRLKYLYVKAKPQINSRIFTGMWIEAGMVHRPWLDYEQKINTYRVQDNMFIERNKIFNSADFGVTIGGNIGEKMDKSFLKKYNGAMKGKWISYVLGIYNGGGYSALEKNQNKVFAARVSTRPLANIFPQLQISAYMNTGKGNTEEAPDFNQLLGFVAYTGHHLTLTAQYHSGIGDFRSRYVRIDKPSISLKNHGYSFFGEYRIPKIKLAIWGRYDFFDVTETDLFDDTQRYIAGITYTINNKLRLILNTEQNITGNTQNNIYEVNLEVSF